MSTLSFPFTFASGALADANQVNSDFASVATVVNGNLEASTNVKVGTPSAQTSATLFQGSSNNLARADHQHTIQCTEQLAADPSSGNFIGRRYFNTSTLKERLCIATGGSGTWVTMGNYSAADLPAHQGSHVPTGTGTDLLDGPMVQATRTANLNVNNFDGAHYQAVAFNATDVFDTDSMHDPVTNNTRITFTHAGVYRFYANTVWTFDATGDRAAIVQLNSAGASNAGNVTLAGATTKGSAVNVGNSFLSVNGLYKATAGDYIELFVAQSSGTSPLALLGTSSALNATGSGNACCNFGAEWVGTGA